MDSIMVDSSNEFFDLSDVESKVSGKISESEHSSVTGVGGYAADIEDGTITSVDEACNSDTVDSALDGESGLDADVILEPPYSIGASPSTKKKKKRHAPTNARQQMSTIAALKEKLAEFPEAERKSSSNISLKKSTKKQTPTNETPMKKTGFATADGLEIRQSSSKKRKRRSKSRPPSSSTQPHPPKRARKQLEDEIKLSVTPDVKVLLQRLSKVGSITTERDIQNIVDVAGTVLDQGPFGEIFEVEIKALLAQEEGWKAMARKLDTQLQSHIRTFMERYGVIPIGALELAGDILA